MSGHSKWTQIKHKKALTDAKKGKLFSRLVREIVVAARTGTPNPDANPRLRTALLRARAAGLPKNNIERAISRVAGSAAGEELLEFLYEASAPAGTSLLIEGITDNKNRTLTEVRRILEDHGTKLADPGSIIWSFEKVGVLEVEKNENAGKDHEAIALAIIESGARDFQDTKDGWVAETAFEDLAKTGRALAERGIRVSETYHDYRAKIEIAPPPKTRQSLVALIDALTEHDDVEEVYTNLKE